MKLTIASAILVVLIGCIGQGSNDAEAFTPERAEQATLAVSADPQFPKQDVTKRLFREAMAFAATENLESLPKGQIMVRLGERFMGAPYLTGPLDGFEKEVVVARLDGFDCFTYVEALMAMARGIAEGDTTWIGYMQRTEEQRYRSGRATDYCARLHYFTEWIVKNQHRELVRDVTALIGGRPYAKRIDYMSTHRTAYPSLVDESTFACIQEVEEAFNTELDLHFIPQDRIAEAYDSLQAGDIVATVTDIAGLDVTHTGLVYLGDDGSVGLLHASTSGGVKVSPDLERYVQGVRAQTGILVARPR
ncbi:MAG: DUF1460 domain-containing protein [Rhodothermales bacterium]|nr:DUF1460 domain-containing protein [Rhodothermales bacterium]